MSSIGKARKALTNMLAATDRHFTLTFFRCLCQVLVNAVSEK